MTDPRAGVWPTPDRLFRPLEQLLRFDLDAAATARNTRCKRFHSPRANGLVQPWDGASVWCNPPYGQKPGTETWVAHGRRECERLRNRVTLLVPVKAETAWYQDLVWGRNQVIDSLVLTGQVPGRWYRLREPDFFVELLELRGRVSFGGDGPGWFASAVVLFNAGPEPVLPYLDLHRQQYRKGRAS